VDPHGAGARDDVARRPSDVDACRDLAGLEVDPEQARDVVLCDPQAAVSSDERGGVEAFEP
jgi:hypothetical protein